MNEMDIVRYFERRGRLTDLEETAIKAKKLSVRFGAIRKIYELCKADVEAGKYDPYPVDWTRFFTPIETDAWCSIRFCGLPFFPQFPILNYFVDFADPVKKIGLELDGKGWHDRENDLARDECLLTHGWRIFRVSGREAYRVLPSPSELKELDVEEKEYVNGVKDWFNDCGEGVIAAIDYVYYRDHRTVNNDLLRFSYQTLDRHRLANFELDPRVGPMWS